MFGGSLQYHYDQYIKRNLELTAKDSSEDLMKLYSRVELCVNLVHDIALICKEARYPEDLEEIYDLLIKNGIDFENLEDNKRWLQEHD